MSTAQEEGGTQPQGVEVPLTDEVKVDTPPADTPPAADTPPEKSADDKPNYDYVPTKFKKADGSPDFEKMAKSYTNLEKLAAKKGTLVPETVDEYQFTFNEDLAPSINPDEVAAFKADLLKNGFSKEQYAFIMDRYQANALAQLQTADKTETVLKAEWGNDFDTQVAVAQKAFDEFAPSDADRNDPVWNHPSVMKLLARMGAELGEDTLAGKGGATKAPAMTEDEVKTIMSSRAYQDGDRALHAKVTSWYQSRR